MSIDGEHRQFRMTPVEAPGRDYSFWSHVVYCLVVGSVAAILIAIPVAWTINRFADDWGRREDPWPHEVQRQEGADKDYEVSNER